MDLSLSPRVRQALYVATVLTSPVVAYLNIVGIIGANEVAFYAAFTTAIGALAAFNVNTK